MSRMTSIDPDGPEKVPNLLLLQEKRNAKMTPRNPALFGANAPLLAAQH